ncbi:MAG: T9SS type A sorting domain-containing protein [Candidatus Marinimicrobia bacterium]|nr:T9SS type A sorting domain-containing protein [Candidatus Neomarinimicrobiota bacterium]MCF7904069.1 T9SS type A sorting domain-containing protein [Candidatus Neomarinimicrobiota bacterium]
MTKILNIHLIFLLAGSFCLYGQPINDNTLQIVFAGGQSNMLGLRSDASELAASDLDSSIAFYFHQGLKPSAGANAFISVSDSTWTHLQPQRQVPFIKGSEYYFGPEYMLARAMATSGINDLGVIKLAYGGTTLAQDWQKGNTSTEELYQLFLDQVGIATDSLQIWGIEYEFIGMAWMQGESDAAYSDMATNYETNLRQFLQDVRSDLNTPNLKVVLGEIANTGHYPYSVDVRDAQAAVAISDPLVSLINTDDLPIGPDNVHWGTQEIITLGTRMGEQLLGLVTGIDADQVDDIPLHYFLLENFPNPFNPETTIRYDLPEASEIQLAIHDMTGRTIAIVQNGSQQAGQHQINWDGRNTSGRLVSTGVYFATLKAEHTTKTIKLLLLR